MVSAPPPSLHCIASAGLAKKSATESLLCQLKYDAEQLALESKASAEEIEKRKRLTGNSRLCCFLLVKAVLLQLCFAVGQDDSISR